MCSDVPYRIFGFMLNQNTLRYFTVFRSLGFTVLYYILRTYNVLLFQSTKIDDIKIKTLFPILCTLVIRILCLHTLSLTSAKRLVYNPNLCIYIYIYIYIFEIYIYRICVANFA